MAIWPTILIWTSTFFLLVVCLTFQWIGLGQRPQLKFWKEMKLHLTIAKRNMFLTLIFTVFLHFYLHLGTSRSNSDSFLSLSSALTVLKQEIPSPFGSDQVKKIIKTSALIKEQVDEIAQIDQVQQTKNGNLASANIGSGGGGGNGNTNNANANIATAATVSIPPCHLNGNSNSNSSTSNELVNCLENVNAQHQPNANDPNDERNESNGLSMRTFSFLSFHYDHTQYTHHRKFYCTIVFCSIRFSFRTWPYKGRSICRRIQVSSLDLFILHKCLVEKSEWMIWYWGNELKFHQFSEKAKNLERQREIWEEKE